MNEWTSCWCFGTPVGASALLLVLRHSCCVGSHVLIGASALMLVLRHSYCVGKHVLIGASALLLVLWHCCCVGRHVLYGATAPQYCIVPSGTYCTASYSFLMIGLGSQTDI